MLKYVLAAAAFTAMCVIPADAQTGPAALPPVESMDCDQMTAEMTVAGQLMSSQLDPEFAAEAQRMNDEREAAYNNRPGVAAGVACSIPGVAYACMASQAAQAQQAQSQADQNIARMNAQADRLSASMTGLDQQRLMALSDRFEQQQCEIPQQ